MFPWQSMLFDVWAHVSAGRKPLLVKGLLINAESRFGTADVKVLMQEPQSLVRFQAKCFTLLITWKFGKSLELKMRIEPLGKSLNTLKRMRMCEPSNHLWSSISMLTRETAKRYQIFSLSSKALLCLQAFSLLSFTNTKLFHRRLHQ